MAESYRKGIQSIFKFSLPLILGQIGQMLFGIGDIAVAGRFSNEVVAAEGIAIGLFSPFLMVGMGITYAIGPLTARLKGEDGDFNGILPNAIIVSLVSSLVLCLLMLLLIKYIYIFAFPADLEPLIKTYLYWVIWSMFPILIYQVLKEYLQAFDDTYFANSTILIFNVINLFLNYIFMFGSGPIPRMGIMGAAIATTLARSGMALILLIYTLRRHPLILKLHQQSVRDIFHMGLPIGLGTLIEVLVFSAVTILIGKMGVLASASHNIVLNLASMTFMIPLAISSAVSVKVGQEFGKKNWDGIFNFSKGALTISSFYMIFTASLYFLIPNLLLRFATDDPLVISYASNLLIFVALFQIPDGIQITLLGSLRGLGITKTPMLATLFSNWLIGLPLGYYLAVERNMNAAGLWAGLAVGLTTLAISLTFLFKFKTTKLKVQTIN